MSVFNIDHLYIKKTVSCVKLKIASAIDIKIFFCYKCLFVEVYSSAIFSCNLHYNLYYVFSESLQYSKLSQFSIFLQFTNSQLFSQLVQFSESLYFSQLNTVFQIIAFFTVSFFYQ